MDNNRLSSFTSADVFPSKLLMADGVAKLRPIHIQWLPTNVCNLQCKFCSCSERTKGLSMPIDTAIAIMARFARLGCKAVTITGGGEPLCYPRLEEMIAEFQTHGIEIGLVTNGLLLDRLSTRSIAQLTWCRISNGDDRTFTETYRRTLDRATAIPIDWAFSYVVSETPNLDEIGRIVAYATEKKFTHVRLVGDLMAPETVPMDMVREHLQGCDDLVIYQPRKKYVPSLSCLVGYIKPIITPDFRMYLCCGAQYALKEQTRDWPEALCMGSALRLDDVYGSPKPFSVPCLRCYYSDYNRVLAGILENPSHVHFL